MGGDRVGNALWRSGKGGAVEALREAGRASKTDVFILLGLNDVTSRAAGMGLEMGGERVVAEVVGGMFSLAIQLKERLQSDQTRVHVLEVPHLPMYELPGNEGMSEDADNINTALRRLGAEEGWFQVHGWDQRLLSLDGAIMPKWLTGRHDVHLNAEGYDVFARLLRALILQEDSDEGEYHVEVSEDDEMAPLKAKKNGRDGRDRLGKRVQGVLSVRAIRQ